MGYVRVVIYMSLTVTSTSISPWFLPFNKILVHKKNYSRYDKQTTADISYEPH